MAINERAKAMRAAGKHVIALAAGEPDFDTPDRARKGGIRAISEGRTHYTESRGIRPLREGIARMLREDRGIACTADHILMAPGGKYAIYETVRTLIDPGEGQEIMILNPGWVSYAPIVSAAGGVPVGVELNFEEKYRITWEALEKAVSPRTRLLIINYPNNPTGCVLSQEEAECVVDFALDHGLLVLSDEVYSTIVYDGAENISPASIVRGADHVITVNGFSKSAAMTGWRLGYICAPREIVDMIQILNQHTMSCLSDFAMEAALKTLQCKAGDGAKGGDREIGVAAHDGDGALILTVEGDHIGLRSADAADDGGGSLRQTASTGSGGDDLAGVSQHVVDQLLQGLILGVLGNKDAAVAVAQQADGIEVIIIQLTGARDLGNLGGFRSEQQLVAVCRLGVDIGGGNAAAGAGAVSEYDGLAQFFLCHQTGRTGDRVANAAGTPHNGALNVLGGISGSFTRLRRGGTGTGESGTGRSAGTAGCQRTYHHSGQKDCDDLFHGSLSFFFRNLKSFDNLMLKSAEVFRYTTARMENSQDNFAFLKHRAETNTAIRQTFGPVIYVFLNVFLN